MSRPAKVIQLYFPLSYVMSPEVTAAWVEAYLKQGPDMDVDSHDEFASILGITRNEAKRLCYQYIYTQPFLKCIQYAARESAYWHVLKP